MSHLSIAVLGQFQITLDAVPLIRFESDKARALLIYLAIEMERPHRREHLLTMFWPDQPESQGRKNLSRTLYRLRQTIQDEASDPPFLLVHRHTIQFNPESDAWIDVRACEAALQEINLDTLELAHDDMQRKIHNLALLQQAVDLYQGLLLEQTVLVDSPEFEAWVLARRDALHDQAISALEYLAILFEQQSNLDQAFHYAQRLVELDPLREASHRVLMRVMAHRGDRTAALKQYTTVCELLETELHIPPEATTTALYEQIRDETFARPSDSATDAPLLRSLALPIPPCPYPGLLPFGEADQRRFFGREHEVAMLVERFRETSFVAVIGPSGSGKSSLIFAGLIPALQQLENCTNGESPATQEGWHIQTMRPGDKPLEALEAALEKYRKDTPTSQNTSPGALPARRLLIVDQFEETFTLGRAAAIPFHQALQQLSETPGCQVLVSVRADFYVDLMLSPLWDLIKTQRIEIAPLDAEGLRQAIRCPARDVGVEVEPALVERLVFDAAGEPGALPLLQETLTLLWEKLEHHGYADEQGKPTLPLSAYEALSEDERTGVQVALAQRGDTALAMLDPEQQVIARRVLLRLIQFGEGRVDTRRQQLLSALRSGNDDPAQFDATIQHLAEQRLLILSGALPGEPKEAPVATDDPSLEADIQPTAAHRAFVDLAHEALITGWPTLYGWLEEQRELEQMRRRLVMKAQEWVRLGRGAGGLLDEAELPEAERWLHNPDTATLGFDADLVALVNASRAALDERERERVLIAQRLQRRAIWLSGALVLALIAALLAGAFGITARESAAEVEGLALLSAAQLALEQGESDQALELAIAAVQSPDPAPHAQAELSEIAYAPGTKRVFTGHTAPVNTVVFSPDGQTVASSSEDLTIRLWDVATGAEVQRLEGHSDPVWGLAFSPDGQTIASGAGNWADSTDTTIRLWDIASGEEVRRFTGHTNLVARLHFSPDGRFLLSSSNDKTVRLWDVATGAELQRLTGFPEWVWAIGFSPDGNTLLTGSEDRLIQLWDRDTGERLLRFQSHEAAVKGVALLPDTQSLLSASWDNTLKVWNPTTGELIRTLNGHTGPIWAMTTSDDGQLAASASTDRSVRLWDIAAGEELQLFEGHNDTVRSVAISPDKQYVVSGAEDNTLRLWYTAHGAELRRFDQAPRPIDTVGFSPDGQFIIAGSNQDDGEGWLWETETGSLVHTFENIKFYRHVFSPNGDVLVYPGDAFAINLWNIASQRVIAQLTGHELSVSALTFNADGSLLLSGAWDATVRLWDVATGEELRRFVVEGTDPIESVAFSPDGQLVAAGTRDDALIYIWETTTGTLVQRIEGHTNQVQSVRFSPDGQTLLSGAGDTTIRLWDTTNWQEVQRFAGHTDTVYSAHFSPDQQLIISSSADTTVRVWDVATGEEIRRFTAHEGAVETVAVSPDGEMVISGGSDGLVHLWRVDTLDELFAWINANRYREELTCEPGAQSRGDPWCTGVLLSAQ